MADRERPAETSRPVGKPERPAAPIDRARVQYLDRVRAIFRPKDSDGLAAGLERFVGQEDVFRHVGLASDGAAMMQCPVHWPEAVRWVPIRDLEILEILEDQDVRAG